MRKNFSAFNDHLKEKQKRFNAYAGIQDIYYGHKAVIILETKLKSTKHKSK